MIVRECHAVDASVKLIKVVDLVCLGGRAVPRTTLKDMEIIWHLGNYWKHSDEWEGSWNDEAKAHPRSRSTIEALNAMGINMATDYPLLEGIEMVVGASWWQALPSLLDAAAAWRTKALKACGCKVPAEDEAVT